MDLEVFDSGAFLFFRLQPGDPVPAFGCGGAEFVELGVAALTDDSAVVRGCGGRIDQGV